MTPERSEFRRGGPVLFAALLGVMCGFSPIPFNTLPLLFGPMNKEFGWSFFELGLGITIFGIVGSLLAPLFGGWADRFGVRRVAIGSLAAFGVTFAALGLMPATVIGYFGLCLLMGLVSIGSTPVGWSRAVNMWFFHNRGLALGIMLIGTSLAAIIVPKLTVWAIGEYGWRSAPPIVALLPLLVGVPVALLLLREPRAEERPRAVSESVKHGATLAEALRDRRFWTLWISIVCVAFAYGGAHISMPQIVGLKGFGPAEAAGVMQVVGLAILLGRVATGALLDRFWAPAVCMPILCLPAAAVLLLTGGGADFDRIRMAAFLLGFAAGAESDLIAYLASRYFGMREYGRIYGMLYMPFGIFSAISPAVYGLVRDRTGSYDPMLYVAGGLFVLGGLLLLTLGPYPDQRTQGAADLQAA